VTHESVEVPGDVQESRGAWHIDHASGSNRVDKFERDIRLLKAALKKEPDNVATGFTSRNPIVRQDALPKRQKAVLSSALT
jgi:hypothetical protein